MAPAPVAQQQYWVCLSVSCDPEISHNSNVLLETEQLAGLRDLVTFTVCLLRSGEPNRRGTSISMHCLAAALEQSALSCFAWNL